VDNVAQTTVVTQPKGYGSVRVDPTEATIAQAPTGTQPSRGTSSVPPPEDSRTASGEYKIKEYKIKFTPDLIQASGNYSSFYGVQGVMQFLFSDMLGDHQLYVASNLQLDLKNSDFIVSYGYLPERIDYGLDLFQNSQLLYVDNAEIDGYGVLTRFRQYGMTAHASNPFDRFSRVDAGLTWFNVSREALQETTLEDQSKPVFVPSVSYIFDNSTMWAFGPIDGTRYNFTASASPKLGENGIGFYTFLGDFRHYIPLGSEYSFAFRGAGGASFGSDPQRFFVGGMENWLNSEYQDNNRLPIENAEDFTFLNPGYPMRGFEYGEQVGSKYFIGNMEFRFPLFRALVTGPLPVLFQYVSGVMFLDVGSAWNNDFNAFGTDSFGRTVTDDLMIGTGLGARAYVFGIPARLDVAWNYNLDSWSKPKYYLSLGYDF
jgi:outer membrane protein assembly factor BamA